MADMSHVQWNPVDVPRVLYSTSVLPYMIDKLIVLITYEKVNNSQNKGQKGFIVAHLNVWYEPVSGVL